MSTIGRCGACGREHSILTACPNSGGIKIDGTLDYSGAAGGSALLFTGNPEFPATLNLAPPPPPVCVVHRDGTVEWAEGLTIEQKIDALAQMLAGQIPRIPPLNRD